jgi:transcriptional regulator with XRE-family HTH domain
MATKQHPKATKPTTSKKRQAQPSAVLDLVGARIRAVRQERGISQDKLAYSIPLDRAHIGLIENGKRAPTVPTLVKLAAALDCEVGDLFPPMVELMAALVEEGAWELSGRG